MVKFIQIHLFLIFCIVAVIAQKDRRPPNFPRNIEIRRGRYVNWARSTDVRNIWIASPSTEQAFVTIANWAYQNNHKVRPMGAKHGWSTALLITETDSQVERTVLVDTTKYLTTVSMLPDDRGLSFVRAQAGVNLLKLLTYLEKNGKGLVSVPANGDITVGGMIAINAHGAGIPNVFEQDVGNYNFGSVSNLVEEVTIVGWNYSSGAFGLITLNRSERGATAIITNLGRIIVTNVVLQVVPNYHLRCESTMNVPSSELFATPAQAAARPGTRTIESYLKTSGRIETIQYPFTNRPWLKVWTRVETRPTGSKYVNKPYNYKFSDNYPLLLSEATKKFILTTGKNMTPAFTATSAFTSAVGITKTRDIWGWSKNTLLFVKASTFRYNEASYVILTNTSYVQVILSDLVPFINKQIKLFAMKRRYPLNGPVEIRVTGLDYDAVDDDQDVAPALSTIRPDKRRSDLNIGIWIGALTFPGTPYAAAFARMCENYLTKFTEGNPMGVLRPEWSKGGGSFLPYMKRQLVKPRPNKIERAVCMLTRFDPNEVFINDFLKLLFGTFGTNATNCRDT